MPIALPRGPLPVALAVAAGIAIAPALDAAGIAVDLRWAAAAALTALALRRPHPLATAAILVALGAAHGHRPAPVIPGGVVPDDRGVDRVVGTVRGPIVQVARDGGALATGARLDTDGDGVWVWTDEPLAPGESVAVTGRVRTPRGPLGPAFPDRAAALRSRGASFEVTAQRVERLGDAPGLAARAWRWAARTQRAWSRAIDDAGGDPEARAALRGIATGDRTAVPAALDARWRAAGIYHVLSVSGLHLAVIAGLAYAVLRRLVAASPWGGRVRPPRWAAPPALALAVAYTLVTGAQLATLRALIVVAVVLGGAVLERPARLIDALGFAALVLLAWRPADLFDPSFQLSFTAALVLALRPPAPPRDGHRVRAWLARGAATSAWVTLATAPITAYHFHQLAPGGVLGNLVLTPVLELLALPLALAGLALELEAPIALATWLVAQVDHAAAALAPVLPTGRVAVTGATTLAVLVGLSAWLAARRTRTRADAIVWLALCLAWAQARLPPPPGALRVTFVDVGQGDAAIVELPGGAVWLVDAGGAPGARGAAAASAAGRTISRVLAAYGHDRVDLAIISHPHPDHYLGLAAIDVPITELWSAAEPEPAPTVATATAGSFGALAAALAATGTRLAHPPLGRARAEADVELIVWAPRYQARDGGPIAAAADPVRSVNDNSLVLELRYRGRAIAFAGDLEREGEELVVAAGLPRVDVVKVAHHGSPTSSSAAFVAATRPALAVISCGRANPFGFPSADVLARWRAAGADIARTDLDGTITVTVDAAGNLAVARFAPATP